MASGSGFSLMSEPLQTIYNKNAVYFFNAEDFNFIDQNRYENIYLIAPPAEKDAWHAALVKDKPFEAISISNNFLEPPARFESPARNASQIEVGGQSESGGSEEKWGLAQNVEFKDFLPIWKIK
jgi:hypothetical protein